VRRLSDGDLGATASSAPAAGRGAGAAASLLGAQARDGLLGLVSPLLALLEVVLHLAVLGQVDRRDLLSLLHLAFERLDLLVEAFDLRLGSFV